LRNRDSYVEHAKVVRVERGSAAVRVCWAMDALARRSRAEERARWGRARAVWFSDDGGQRHRCPPFIRTQCRSFWRRQQKPTRSSRRTRSGSFRAAKRRT